MVTITSTAAGQNARKRSGFRETSGWLHRCCRRANAASSSTASAISPNPTTGCDDTAASPTDNSPSKRPRTGWRSSRTTNQPRIANSTPKSSGTQNTLAQPNCDTRKPVTMGAVAGPMVIMEEPSAKQAPRFCRGTRCTTTFIMRGMNTPAPSACTMRNSSSDTKPPEAMPPREPAMFKAAAAKNSARSEKRRYR